MDHLWLQQGLAIARQNLAAARARLATLDSSPDPYVDQLDAELTALADGPSVDSSRDDMFAALPAAPLILVGDFATSSTPKDLAVEALTHAPGATLALTLPEGRHKSLVADFLANRGSAAQLFADARLAESIPRFAWKPYVGLLKTAARLGRRVELVESDLHEPLRTRQETAVRRLSQLAEQGPVVALMGELRLADLALKERPEQLRSRCVRLLCDAAGPFFRGISAGRDGTGTAQLAPQTWSRQTQPPMTRLLGFINWCENNEESLDGPAMASRFRSFAQTISKRFALPAHGAGRPAVFAPGDPRYLAVAAASCKFSAAQMEHLATSYTNGESRYLPEANIAYLGQPALSHVAEEAAHFLRTRTGGAGVGLSSEDRFWSIAIHEMAAYLGSKVIVPSRQAPTLPPNLNRDEIGQETLAHLYGYQMAEKLWRRRDHDAVRKLVKTLYMQDLVEPGVAKGLYFRSLTCVADRRR